MSIARRWQLAAAHLLRALSFDQRLAVLLLLLLALLPLTVGRGGGYLLLVAERAAILAIAALSLELLVGTGGMLSFGHAAFLGIGAYAPGVLASHGHTGLSAALPAALVSCSLFALLTGAVAVRTRGVHFIMITLAFGQMAFFIAASLAPYGGDDGLTYPSRTLVAGSRILKHELAFFYVALGCLALAYGAAQRLVASRFGRVLRGLTDNELRMQAIGFAPYPYRLTLYVFAGTLCGLAGFLLGNQAEFVSPAYMHWQRSGELILMVLLGGTGTLVGPLLGAVSFLALEEVLSQWTEHWKLILGPLLIVVVLSADAGIAGAMRKARRPSLAPAEWRAAFARLFASSFVQIATHRGELESRMRRLAERSAPGLRRCRRRVIRLRRRWHGAKMAVGGPLVALVLAFERLLRRW